MRKPSSWASPSDEQRLHVWLQVRLQGYGGLPMNMNRPDMTEDVKYKYYTNNFLQMDSNLATMEVSGASCSMRIFCQKF